MRQAVVAITHIVVFRVMVGSPWWLTLRIFIARAKEKHTKTDRIDAQLISRELKDVSQESITNKMLSKLYQKEKSGLSQKENSNFEVPIAIGIG
ncbi:hypothetical protein Q4Q35_15830 [Flavivirga aquimarina]|uniref:Transposase IS111A/IS1328/IS1533 N-terminal domain-containing protein n=1 Tax=Flavivirga aquimarina TaxID=2027862 RepID=A0ABT8WDP0_9FLAO|nr:hypothetical protein [Flavivirga aquimarina]MDO5971278.1 hypothetical protein [Flavivirga aquimarina]